MSKYHSDEERRAARRVSQREWRARNPERVKAQRKRAYAKRKQRPAVEDDFRFMKGTWEWFQLFWHWTTVGSGCACCGAELKKSSAVPVDRADGSIVIMHAAHLETATRVAQAFAGERGPRPGMDPASVKLRWQQYNSEEPAE